MNLLRNTIFLKVLFFIKALSALELDFIPEGEIIKLKHGVIANAILSHNSEQALQYAQEVMQDIELGQSEIRSNKLYSKQLVFKDYGKINFYYNLNVFQDIISSNNFFPSHSTRKITEAIDQYIGDKYQKMKNITQIYPNIDRILKEYETKEHMKRLAFEKELFTPEMILNFIKHQGRSLSKFLKNNAALEILDLLSKASFESTGQYFTSRPELDYETYILMLNDIEKLVNKKALNYKTMNFHLQKYIFVQTDNLSDLTYLDENRLPLMRREPAHVHIIDSKFSPLNSAIRNTADCSFNYIVKARRISHGETMASIIHAQYQLNNGIIESGISHNSFITITDVDKSTNHYSTMCRFLKQYEDKDLIIINHSRGFSLMNSFELTNRGYKIHEQDEHIVDSLKKLNLLSEKYNTEQIIPERNMSLIKEHIKVQIKEIQGFLTETLKGGNKIFVQAAGNRNSELKKDETFIVENELHAILEGEQELLEHFILVGNYDPLYKREFRNKRMSQFNVSGYNKPGPYKDIFVLAANQCSPILRPQGIYTFDTDVCTSGGAAFITDLAACLAGDFPTLSYKQIRASILGGANRNFAGYSPELHGMGLANYKNSYLYAKNILRQENEVAHEIIPRVKMGENTPLHCAIKANNADEVRILIENSQIREILLHAEHIRDKHGNTPLTLAIQTGSVNVIKVLLHNPHVRSVFIKEEYLKDDYGYSPLHFAAGSGQINIVEAILKIEEMSNLLLQDKYWKANEGEVPMDACPELNCEHALVQAKANFDRNHNLGRK